MALDGELAWPAVDNVPVVQDGVRIAPGARVADGVELRGPVLVHAGASIGREVELGPHVVVGHDVEVGAGSHLQDTVLGSATTLGARVRATGLATGPGATLPDELTVLGDTVIGPGTRVPDGRGPLPAGTRIPEPRD